MLGYLAVAFLYGYGKSRAMGAPRKSMAHAIVDVAAAPVLEEVLFRGTLEPGLRTVGASPLLATGLTAGAFSIGHSMPVEAALGGVFYSRASAAGGLGLAIATHAAHNLGVHFGGTP